jgi:apolipoprotein N-acyltransferase
MAFILWLAHVIRVRAGNVAGFTALVSFWMAFEYLSLHSIYLSPWVNLGNGLSKEIMLIQWYEATGVAGGTLWILLSNLLLTIFLVNSSDHNRTGRLYLAIWLSLIIVPSAASVLRYYTIDQSESGGNEVVIIQPNVDPFTQKYVVPFEEQLSRVLNMAGQNITEKTDWVLTPETTIDDPVNEDDIENNKYIRTIREFAFQHPGINIISGLVSFRIYSGAEEAPTNSARKIDTTGNYYDHFNSAFKIDTGKTTAIYHKSKLVTGIEMQFSSGFGKLVQKILPDLGGTKWGYGVQEKRTCFTHSSTGQIAAPIICYESVYGDYVADYVREGAEALFIITNDGWWRNTNGYRHHLSYASLRAIETRRPVARCGNTGVSCIIDIRGKRIQETEWWTSSVLKGKINSETTITPYIRHGDYLFKMFSVMSILLLLYVFIAQPIKKIRNGK